MWNLVLLKLQKRLSLWHGLHLSLGGIIILINVVLSSLLMYYFSFYKALKVVLKEITTIHRYFLWGGSEDKGKVN